MYPRPGFDRRNFGSYSLLIDGMIIASTIVVGKAIIMAGLTLAGAIAALIAGTILALRIWSTRAGCLTFPHVASAIFGFGLILMLTGYKPKLAIAIMVAGIIGVIVTTIFGSRADLETKPFR